MGTVWKSVPAVLVLALIACTPQGRVEFILCPSEVRTAFDQTSDLGARRELLFPLDYDVLIVQRFGEDLVPAPVQRAQHTMGSPRPATSTFDSPAHVSDFFVLDAPSDPIGVAIRRAGEAGYRVQWLTDADLSNARRTSVIFLKPLADLPPLAAR